MLNAYFAKLQKKLHVAPETHVAFEVILFATKIIIFLLIL